MAFKGGSRTPYHRDCLSAESYFERHARKICGPQALQDFKMRSPRDYRYKIMELIGDRSKDGGHSSGGSGSGSHRRGAAERARTTELCNELKFFASSYKQQYVFMLSERAFKQWF